MLQSCVPKNIQVAKPSGEPNLQFRKRRPHLVHQTGDIRSFNPVWVQPGSCTPLPWPGCDLVFSYPPIHRKHQSCDPPPVSTMELLLHPLKASWMILPSTSVPIAPMKAHRRCVSPTKRATRSVFIAAPPGTTFGSLAVPRDLASSTICSFSVSCKPVASVPGAKPKSCKCASKSSSTEITSTSGIAKSHQQRR